MINPLIEALEFLFPGLISILILRLLAVVISEGWLFIVYAFVLTMLIQFVHAVLAKILPVWLLWNSNWDYEILVSIAILSAFIIAPLWEKDVLHSILRKCHITKESARSARQSAFSRRDDCYVILHLDGRRLFGWPEKWPSARDDEYIFLKEAEWIVDKDEDQQESNEQSSASHMLVPISKIELIEFVVGTRE